MNVFKVQPVTVSDRWLEVHFSKPHQILSWAVLGGGWTQSQKVLWYRVNQNDLTPDVNVQDYFKTKLLEAGKEKEIVGFLTSASLLDFSQAYRFHEGSWARCVATVGLSNALRIGDPPSPHAHIGTINILLQTSEPLNQLATLEAFSLASEARTIAILEARIPSSRTLLWSTGTGTDCIAVASPIAIGTPSFHYAGKHTPIGHLIGSVVHEAVAEGARKWKKKWRNSF